MKPSRYNRIFQASDGTWLAFNAWSTALAEIESGDLEFIQAYLAEPDGVSCDTGHKRDIREALIAGHFLIEDNVDELATLKADMFRDRFRTDQLHLTIAPTLDCNFRCDYCYEDHLRVTMARPVQDALIRWVEERAGSLRELHVTWYGGEPLLPRSLEVVRNLSRAFIELSEKHGMEYNAHLVTNGYLLDRPKMEELASLKVGKVQVTLDGPPEIHDKRRHLTGGQGTFDRIVQNLEDTLDLAEFQLRINVDRRNSMACLDVVQLLADKGLAAMVRPYIAQVTLDGAACGNIMELCYSSEDYARVEVEIYREAAQRGLPLSRYPFRLNGSFCTVDRVNGYVIAPSGSLFKCWHEVTMAPENSIGSVIDGVEPFHKVNEDRWLAWDPMEKSGCRSCDVLPICHGGCPLAARDVADPDRGACEHYKYHLEPLLEIRHHYRQPTTGGPPSRGGVPEQGE